jgi:endonuclease/exonuclease/phosphatase (EEP) superfamily protein YafD
VVAWSVAVPVALWALIRTFGLESGYPLVPLISYTPYVTATSLVALAACLLLRRWAAAVVAGVAALALVSAIAPRMIGSDYSNSEGVRLTVMTANVYKGQGDPEQLLAYVRERDVDVLAVQELTPMFVEAFEREGIGGELRFTALAPREGVTGSGIYSRHHLTDTTSGRAEFLQMSALVEVAGAVSVVSVHPKPPTSSRAVEEWESSLDQFQLPSDEEDLGATQLLLGDFNATLDQAAFRDV